MSFHYQVYTSQEAASERFQLLNAGEYDAVIAKSEDRTSSTGNPMMDMTLHVYDDNGKEHAIRDFLVFTKAMMWKVINFAESAALMDVYEAGQLCSEKVVNARVRVNVAIETGSEIPRDKLNGKPVGSKYPDKNKVAEYMKREGNAPSLNASDNNNDLLDDDIPF